MGWWVLRIGKNFRCGSLWWRWVLRLGDDVREGCERKVVSVYRVTVATVGYARAAADNTNHRKRGISDHRRGCESCVLFSKKKNQDRPVTNTDNSPHTKNYNMYFSGYDWGVMMIPQAKICQSVCPVDKDCLIWGLLVADWTYMYICI